MNGPIQARVFQGTRDLLPEDMLPRQRMLRVMTQVFELFGFAPVETPVMEFLDILLGKYGEEGDKLIYPLAYKGGDKLGLRYDLTVPLSRLVAMHGDLPRPFKRYQIQAVYRADRPQPAQGRFREFYQCDVDTVGSASLVADAENLAVCYQVFRALGLCEPELGLVMRVNSRKLLRALVTASGLNQEQDKAVCTVLDKIDKIGQDKVLELLSEQGIPVASQKRLFELINLGTTLGAQNKTELIAALGRELGEDSEAQAALAEMTELFEHCSSLGIPTELIQFDLVLTRGLDYYTGPIYEFRLEKLENFGSLGGGGRYDDLMSIYGIKDMPATGVSIGLSRVQSALMKLGTLKQEKTPTRVIVTRMADQTAAQQLALAREFREAGIPAEVYYDDARMKKQIGHADKQGVPFIVIQGSDEVEKGVIQLKELATGQQHEVSLTEAIALVKASL